MPPLNDELMTTPTQASAINCKTEQLSNTVGDPPKVIGIYGIPGSGKTFLMNQLKRDLSQEQYIFFEGSETIGKCVPGGLQAFQNLDESSRMYWRKVAIEDIKKNSASCKKTAIVTGHLIFWSENEEEGQPVYTQNDMTTFTHILYLEVPAQVIEQRNRCDTRKTRQPMTRDHIQRLQQAEKAKLRELCRHHGILFAVLAADESLVEKATVLAEDFRLHSEEYNMSYIQSKLDQSLGAYKRIETALVFDADRTLAAEDTGALFWKEMSQQGKSVSKDCLLKTLFSGPLGHTYNAFRQAALLYEEVVNENDYDDLCQSIASAVTMQPEFKALLHMAAKQKHIRIIVVSCGLGRVWEKVLQINGLSESIRVIAGGRIADGFVVTAKVKVDIVARLQDFHQAYVWAFGDSPLDLPMLKKADQAIVVVGQEQSRSKSMDAALSHAIEHEGLKALQLILPSNSNPRLRTARLPVISLGGIELVSSIFRRPNPRTSIPIFIAENRNAAKLLATSMRNAAVSEPALRDAHRRVGWYLAHEIVSQIIGIEDCLVSHVLGHSTQGYRLLGERKTTIVALMRAGEPMALGVNEAFPLAMFVHAGHSDDIKIHHLRDWQQIVLVDSVINSGKTILEFVQAIRSLDANISIVVVAGVIQAQCVSPKSNLRKTLASHGNISIVTLRLSDT